MPWLCNNIKKFVVPSAWCKNLYRSFSLLDHAEITVWPSGIDTELWKPLEEKPKGEKTKILLYYKNREKEELIALLKILEPYDVHVALVQYGHYSEDYLLDTCRNSDCAILLTGTESQGIAYMQILSSNLPCLVFDKSLWHYRGLSFPATSVPYFDNTCGVVTEHIDSKMIENFLNNYSGFEPRKFITGQFTLEKSAKDYMDLFISQR
jgi:hypothetical protein